MNNNLLLTHNYDGKFNNSINIFEKDILRVSRISKMDKLKAFSELQINLSNYKNFSQNCKKCLNEIINSFLNYGRNEKSKNYDPINKLYADDLLYLSYEKIIVEKNTDFTNILISQLEDMISGLCSQGRTTRLFQILFAFH